MKTTDATQPIPGLLAILLGKAGLIVSITALFALIGFVYASLQPAVYEARATILIDESASNVPSYDAILANERRAQTYAYLFTSDALLSRAFNTLENRPPTLDELETLRRGVEVQAVRGTQLVRIAVRDTDQLRATGLIDALVNAFTSRFHEINGQRNSQTRDVLQEQLVSIDRQIDKVSSQISSVTGASRAQLEPTLVQLRETQASVLVQMTKLQVDEVRGQLGITQVEPATTSDKPVAPNKPLFAGVAACLGALIAIGLTLIIELRQSDKQALQPLFANLADAETKLQPRRQETR